MKVLVTGGTGFIGSHTAVELIQAGHEIVIVDNLYNSSADVIDRIEKITGVRPPFVEADLADKEALRAVFRENTFDAVIHFAGYKAVGESVRKPLEYYKNNIGITITLVEVMEEFGCSRIIFSSSATVYGPNNPAPYVETMPALESTNPYGRTKLMIEQILRDYCFAHPEFTAVLLRYFNPIGAHESGLLGDDPSGIPNNLMPYLARTAAGQLEKLTVFGDDYPTPDGTCLRDYLHVVDLAKGHIKAMEYAMSHTGAEAFNLGTGNGVSVLEIIHAFESATGAKVPYVIGPRREGDLAANWADPTKAETVLGWKALKSLEDMCRDSWNFVQHRKAELEK
ncbi:MAG: UDP-glucose 4-epimerase GalE [Firmicutes bacterium]|nr:UDP-glucose 4-epimerase GalE [Bacillota bacterium]